MSVHGQKGGTGKRTVFPKIIERKIAALVGSSSDELQNSKTCFHNSISKVVLASPA